MTKKCYDIDIAAVGDFVCDRMSFQHMIISRLDDTYIDKVCDSCLSVKKKNVFFTHLPNFLCVSVDGWQQQLHHTVHVVDDTIFLGDKTYFLSSAVYGDGSHFITLFKKLVDEETSVYIYDGMTSRGKYAAKCRIATGFNIQFPVKLVDMGSSNYIVNRLFYVAHTQS